MNNENKRNMQKVSFKNAILICVVAVIINIVLPFLLDSNGIDSRLFVVIGNGLFTSLAVAYGKYFIDEKTGFSKKFLIMWILFGSMLALMTYLWLFKYIYV